MTNTHTQDLCAVTLITQGLGKHVDFRHVLYVFLIFSAGVCLFYCSELIGTCDDYLLPAWPFSLRENGEKMRKWSGNGESEISLDFLIFSLSAPSGALIAIPTYYWPTPTHFFRPHWSTTLDFHFLSNYSSIKAIMLYKGNHWTRCAGFMDASWIRLGITNDDLGIS